MTGEQQFSLTLNIPLSRWLPDSWAMYNVNRSDKSNTSHQLGIGGTALQDNNLSYNLQQSYTDNNVGYGASINGRYRSSVGNSVWDIAMIKIVVSGITVRKVRWLLMLME